MSEKNHNNTFDPFDPMGLMKDMRDQGMNSWAKMMVELVNSDAYAQASGTMLDTWLSQSGPMRKALENAMAQSLANLNLPSRQELAVLAERLTNIEMRMDDMDAKLDDLLRATADIAAAVRKTPKAKAANKAEKQA